MTNTLYLPRHYRRPLLFPPGLLALAWLLWLGCVALPQMQAMEPPQVVMQVTALPIHSDAFGFLPPAYSSEQQLEEFRAWQTVSFAGNQWADYFSYKQALNAAAYVNSDYTYKAGLRVKFEPSSTYDSFVFIINMLYEKGINKWWVDFQHSPTTLYMFTSRPEPSDQSFVCGTSDYVIRLPEPEASFKFAALFHPDWRNTTLLLLLLVLLSTIRLYRQWRTN
jgi:hypothetical protein